MEKLRSFVRKMTKKPSIVILDLDETLVHMSAISEDELEKHSEHGSDAFIIAISNPGGLTYVRKRKHSDHFISELKKAGKKIVVWSAGRQIYVKAVCNVIFGRDTLDFLLTDVDHCACGNRKNIQILGSHGLLPDFKLDDAVLIDDNPGNAFDNPKHFIEIKSFYDQDDHELLRVLKLII